MWKLIFDYLEIFIIHADLKPQYLTGEKMPQSMMLLTPCFTMGMLFWCCAFLFIYLFLKILSGIMAKKRAAGNLRAAFIFQLFFLWPQKPGIMYRYVMYTNIAYCVCFKGEGKLATCSTQVPSWLTVLVFVVVFSLNISSGVTTKTVNFSFIRP